MENKITVIKIVAAALILVFLVTCIPRNINIEYPAIRYSENDSDAAIQTSVVIKGKLFKPLFFSSRFEGTFIVEEYDFSKEYKLMDVSFGRGFDKRGTLVYYTYNVEEGGSDIKYTGSDIKHIGSIWISGNMDRICILGISPEYAETEGAYAYEPIIISAPAETREDAVQIADQLIPEDY